MLLENIVFVKFLLLLDIIRIFVFIYTDSKENALIEIFFKPYT